MQHRGCKPDAVTFGGLIAAYDRAGGCTLVWRQHTVGWFESQQSWHCAGCVGGLFQTPLFCLATS